MEKRGFIFSTSTAEVYNTADSGWTLTAWEFTEPEFIENYIDVPGRLDGPIDASTALTDGDPRYKQRKLTATFECSEGTRAEREGMITNMKQLLHGLSFSIEFPDYDDFQARGRVRVERIYNDNAHASVRMTAICEPWLYRNEETLVEIALEVGETKAVEIKNNGRRLIFPSVNINNVGTRLWGNGSGGLSYTPHSMGRYALDYDTEPLQLPDFFIWPGETFTLYCESDKTVGLHFIKLSYREAVL